MIRSARSRAAGIGERGLDAPEDRVRLVAGQPGLLGRLPRGEVQEGGRGRVAPGRVVEVPRRGAAATRARERRPSRSARASCPRRPRAARGPARARRASSRAAGSTGRRGARSPAPPCGTAPGSASSRRRAGAPRPPRRRASGRAHRWRRTGPRGPGSRSPPRPRGAAPPPRSAAGPSGSRSSRRTWCSSGGRGGPPLSARGPGSGGPPPRSPPAGGRPSSLSVAFSSIETRRGRSASPARLARAAERGVADGGVGVVGQAEDALDLVARSLLAEHLDEGGLRRKRRRRRGAARPRAPRAPRGSRGAPSGAPRSRAASAEPSSGRRSGRTAAPPRRVAAGMADEAHDLVGAAEALPDEGQGRGVPALAEHRDDVGAALGRRRAGLLDPAERRLAPRDLLGQEERRASEGPVGAVRGREEVGQGARPEGRHDERQGRRRVLRLPGLTVVLEDRAGRVQPLGRPTRLEQAPGVEEIERGRGRSLPVRGGHARPRERGPRRGVADVGQGEEGRLAEPLVRRCPRAGGASSPPRASGPLRAPGRAPRGRSAAPCRGPRGALSSPAAPRWREAPRPPARPASRRRGTSPGAGSTPASRRAGPARGRTRRRSRPSSFPGRRGEPARRGPARLRPRGA